MNPLPVIVLVLMSPTLEPTSPAASEAPHTLSQLDERIAGERQHTFTVPARDPETEVSYRLVRHGFEFGTALNAHMLGATDAWFPADAPKSTLGDHAEYQRIARDYFSAAVMENAMKWPLLCGPGCEPRRRDAALEAAAWCERNGLHLRGHTLMWGVSRWLPDWQKELATKPPEEIEEAIRAHFRHTLREFKGRVGEWDLNNEMMHEDIFAEAMDLESQADYFRWAREVDPEIRFYVNEYGVLQGDEVDRYTAHIRGLLEDGAVIGGIGDQAHFFKPVPSIEELWRILDQLGQFGLPVKITEFDLAWRGMTPEEQAEGLVRFYKTCFAHPAVEGIYMWGFWEGRHWRKDAAIWKADWTPTPAAEAYTRLMTEEWTTRGSARPRDGAIRFRGFPGLYEFRQGDTTWTLDLQAP